MNRDESVESIGNHNGNYGEGNGNAASRYLTGGLSLVVGAGLGAGLMFLYDPNRGRVRRARLGRKAEKLAGVYETRIEHKTKDLLNRAQGLVAEAAATLRREERPVPDHVLADRVRSRAGHLVARLNDFQVDVDGGVVTLRGTVGRAERKRLLHTLRETPGLKGLRDQLRCEGSFVNPRSLASLAGLVLMGLGRTRPAA